MRRPLLFHAARLAIVLSFAPSLVAADVSPLISVDAPQATASAEPEQLEAEEVFSPWQRFYNIRTAFGYKDNLLLSALDRDDSAFFHSNLEFFALRLPVDAPQLSFFLSADDYRYFSSQNVDKEQSLISYFELKQEVGENWTITLPVDYFYQDQVFDTSTEDLFRATQIQGHRVGSRPSLRRKLPHKMRLELQPGLARQELKAPLDDYWEGSSKLLFGWEYGHGSDLTAAYDFRLRPYDTRCQLETDGTVIPDSNLSYYQHEIEAGWKHNWDEKKHWRTRTRVSVERNEDNGGGFFNYWKYRASQDLQYRRAPWELSLGAKARRYEYDSQSIDAIDFIRRVRTLVEGSFKAEVEVAKYLKLFAEYAHERSIGNDPIDEYKVNVISAGLNFEF